MTALEEKGSLLVRRALFNDMEDVSHLADINHLRSKGNPDKGFLVSGYTLEDYQRVYYETNLFYVVEEDGDVRGFILGYKQEDLNYSEVVNKSIRDYAGSEFLVVKQICVDPYIQGRGYGRALFQKFIQESENLQRGIYLSIVLEPYNKTSVSFHKSLGFSKVFEIVPEDGFLRGVNHKPYI